MDTTAKIVAANVVNSFSNALETNQTGNDLTCIGCGCTASAAALINASAIGAHAVVAQSNSLVRRHRGKNQPDQMLTSPAEMRGFLLYNPEVFAS